MIEATFTNASTSASVDPDKLLEDRNTAGHNFTRRISSVRYKPPLTAIVSCREGHIFPDFRGRAGVARYDSGVDVLDKRHSDMRRGCFGFTSIASTTRAIQGPLAEMLAALFLSPTRAMEQEGSIPSSGNAARASGGWLGEMAIYDPSELACRGRTIPTQPSGRSGRISRSLSFSVATT